MPTGSRTDTHKTQHKSHGRVERFTVDQVAEVLIKCKGMIALASRILRCERNTVYGYIKRHKRLRRIIEDERELFIDNAEYSLQDAVAAREGWAVCFALKCLGRSRGYIERLEHSGPDGGPVEFTFVIQRPEQAVLPAIAQIALTSGGNGEPGDGQ